MEAGNPETLKSPSISVGQTDIVGYFGYGSLVNRATHRTPVVHAVPARLMGKARKWRPRPDMPGFPAALLTVFRAEDEYVDGLLIFEKLENLPAIDAREARYDRVLLEAGEIEFLEEVPYTCPLFVYQAKENIPAHRDPPKILQSYLDAVMQGYVSEHGRTGLRKFLETTRSFDIAVHGDRGAPVYPRSINLTPEEIALFDTLLVEFGIGVEEA